MATKYVSALTGPQMDSALLDMANHNSEAYAIGERGGVAVSAGDVTYHNNSKYYCDLVSTNTDRAEAAANRAEAAVPSGTAGAVFFDRAQSLTTAQQSQARANIMAGGSNRNLLDNPWFGSGEVVNQRGNTSGTVSNTYFIDRWKLSGTYSIAASGITFTCNAGAGVSQIFPHALTIGETYTFSVMYGDGSIVSCTFAPLANRENAYPFGDGLYLEIDTRAAFPTHRCIIYTPGTSWSKEIKAVKLELGSVSTLANDAPPDYGMELAKCQRYFIRIKGDPIGSGYVTAGLNQAYIHIPTPVPMRTAPTASINGSMYIRGTGATWNVSTVSVPSTSLQPTNGVSVIAAVNASQVMAVCAYMSSANSYIDLSANL